MDEVQPRVNDVPDGSAAKSVGGEGVGRRRILTINGGSSSLKFALFERTDPSSRLLSGRVDRIGQADARWVVAWSESGRDEDLRVDAPDLKSAGHLLIDWLERSVGFGEIATIGHRVVHGGSCYHQPERVTAELIEGLGKIRSFDPDHMPGEIDLIEAFRKRAPDLPQVVCFDTAFHHDMPRVARIVPIPRRYEAVGVRRYGFHGLSYAYLMEELARIAGPEEARGRIILAHLGS
ncbi:acetate/propionate family kinase, partial [Singulisphaera rosea]